MSRQKKLAVLVAAMVIGLSAVPVAAAHDGAGPRTSSWAAAFLYSVTVAPNANTPGANDWSCHPSSIHPRPVVLVHGTWENRYVGWSSLAPRLADAGYCVFALNYGDEDSSSLGRHPALKGTADIRRSARELADFVQRVRVATRARQVDIVGHSQGGTMARWYLRFLAGRAQVRSLITLGATHHGTTLSGLATLGKLLHLTGRVQPVIGTAGIQQAKGSAFIAALNARGDTEPGVSYTIIATRYDKVSTPYRDTFLNPGREANVNNVMLQAGCPLDLSDHLSMCTSPRTIGLVENALDPAHPRALPCRLWLPIV